MSDDVQALILNKKMVSSLTTINTIKVTFDWRLPNVFIKKTLPIVLKNITFLIDKIHEIYNRAYKSNYFKSFYHHLLYLSLAQ